MSESHKTEPKGRVSPIATRVGPLFDFAGLRRLTSWTPDEIMRRCESHSLLSLVTADNATVFPAFQFKRDQTHPGLSELLRVLLASGVDTWTVALWLVTGHEELSGTAPIRWLQDEPDLRPLLVTAHTAAARWAA